MSDFDELEDILISIRKKDENLIDSTPIEPPVKSRAQRAAEEAEKKRLEEIAAEKARLEQERIKQREMEQKAQLELKVSSEPIEELEQPKKSISEPNKELVWFKPEPKNESKKPKKKEKSTKLKQQKIRFSALGAKIKPVLKKIFTKQLAIIAVVIVLIIAIGFGGFKLYEYSKVAYLKPYEKQYGIEYPTGILEQFCDKYGQNQNIVGAVSIDDTNTNKYVTSQKTSGYAYAFVGTNVYAEQQFMSVDLTGYADLESVYSTADGFLNSSQLITFNTLFEKSQYKVVAAYYTNENAEDDSDYVFPYNIYGNLTQKSFEHFADSVEHRRLYDTGYTYSYEDSFLTLSVDSDFMADFKFVVVCVKTDKFEKSTTAVDNDNIHYPQIWYDVKNESNPYRFSGKWYPEIYTNDEKTKTQKLTANDFDFR